MEQLITLLMPARTLIHTYHLRSKGPGSYAQHMALGELYDALSGHIDSLAEVHQGMTGSLLKLESFPAFTTDQEPVSQVREIATAIESMRGSVQPKSTVIENMIDELLKDLYQTIYKLTFLK